MLSNFILSQMKNQQRKKDRLFGFHSQFNDFRQTNIGLQYDPIYHPVYNFQHQMESKTLIMLKKANYKLNEALIKYRNLQQKCQLYEQENETLEKNIKCLLNQLSIQKQANAVLKQQNFELQRQIDQKQRYYENLIFQGKRKVQEIIGNCRQENHYLRHENQLISKKNKDLEQKCQSMRNKIHQIQLQNQFMRQNVQRARQNYTDKILSTAVQKLSQVNISFQDTYSQDLWQQKYLDLLQLVKYVSDKRAQYHTQKQNCEEIYEQQYNPQFHNKQRLFSFSGNLKQMKQNFK